MPERYIIIGGHYSEVGGHHREVKTNLDLSVATIKRPDGYGEVAVCRDSTSKDNKSRSCCPSAAFLKIDNIR